MSEREYLSQEACREYVKVVGYIVEQFNWMRSGNKGKEKELTELQLRYLRSNKDYINCCLTNKEAKQQNHRNSR